MISSLESMNAMIDKDENKDKNSSINHTKTEVFKIQMKLY